MYLNKSIAKICRFEKTIIKRSSLNCLESDARNTIFNSVTFFSVDQDCRSGSRAAFFYNVNVLIVFN